MRRCFPLIILLLFFARATFAETSEETGKPEKAPPNQAQLKIEKNSEGVDGVVLKTYLKGDIKDIWEIVTNPQNVPKLFKSIKSVEHIKREESGDEKVIRDLWTYRIDSPFGDKTLKLLTVDDHRRYVSNWKRQSGDLNAFEGEWRLKTSEKFPNYTMVIYKSYIDGGTFAPQFITNKLNKSDTEGMLVELKRLLFQKQKSD